jgi:hypothetical protein
MDKDPVMTGELGGRHFARGVILSWLVHSGGSGLKLLETATGIPQKLLSWLLAEMMAEKTVRLDGAIFRQDTRGCLMDKIKVHSRIFPVAGQSSGVGRGDCSGG